MIYCNEAWSYLFNKRIHALAYTIQFLFFVINVCIVHCTIRSSNIQLMDVDLQCNLLAAIFHVSTGRRHCCRQKGPATRSPEATERLSDRTN